MKKKHKILLFTIGTLLILSLCISTSYALWASSVTQESENVVSADCFEITFVDSNPIHLEHSFPMRDSDGVQTTPYEFTIKNICNHAADFQINLETLSASTLDASNIKADLNGRISEYGNATSVTPTFNNASSAARLYSDTLASNETKSYNLRLWIKEDAVQSEIENKIYSSKISVIATPKYKYQEATLITGPEFNALIKQISGDTNPSVSTLNNSILSFQRSVTPPTEDDDAKVVSTSNSDKQVLIWYKDGNVYLYSDSDKIYMNKNSSSMFRTLKSITSMDLSYFDTSNVTNMEKMFWFDQKLESLDVSNFDTSKVTNMSGMFASLEIIKHLDVSNFNTSKVKNMSGMFIQMYKLESLDVTNFDTSNVIDMSELFFNLESITEIDVRKFNTSKVTDMTSMFNGAKKLKNLDLSSFDTSNVTGMNGMFAFLENIEKLDISSFDTRKVTNMVNMFYKMENIKTIYVGKNFDTTKVTNSLNMFLFDNKLKGEAGTAYDTNHTDVSYARVDDPTNGKPGYFTLKTN